MFTNNMLRIMRENHNIIELSYVHNLQNKKLKLSLTKNIVRLEIAVVLKSYLQTDLFDLGVVLCC